MKAKNGNIILIIIVMILSGVIVYLFINDEDLKGQLETIKERRLILEEELEVLYQENDKLRNLPPKIKWKTKIIETELKAQEHETDEISNNVVNYPDWKLDSILSNHRHTKRTKNRDSINN